MTITFVFTLTATLLQSNIASLLLFPPMFPRVRSPCTFSLSGPNTFFLLSSVVTLCSHFLFTDNIHHLIPGLVPVPVISSLTHVILQDSFAILSSRNDTFRNKRS